MIRRRHEMGIRLGGGDGGVKGAGKGGGRGAGKGGVKGKREKR